MSVFDMGKGIPPEKPLSVGELISEAHKVVSSLIDTKGRVYGHYGAN